MQVVHVPWLLQQWLRVRGQPAFHFAQRQAQHDKHLTVHLAGITNVTPKGLQYMERIPRYQLVS